MRLLITTDTVGGVWTFGEELTEELLRLGHEIVLVSFGRQPSAAQSRWAKGVSEQYGNSFRFVPTEIPLEWMQNNGCAYNDGAEVLCKLARATKVDVLISSQFCFGALPLPILKIVVAHSDVFSWAEACQEEPLASSEWLSRYKAMVEDGLAGASAVVAPTRWMMSALARRFTLPESTAVIANGRSVASQTEMPRKLQAVSAGRFWDVAKNLEMLREVKAEMPLLVAGEMQGESGSEVAVPERVQMLGSLDGAALMRLFSESAIYVCTSKYEPFGLAPLEAALCGCAILANDIASLREVWGDGAEYFRSAEELTELLRKLQESPAALSDLQRRSGARAEMFTARKMAAGYVELIEVLQSQRGGEANAA